VTEITEVPSPFCGVGTDDLTVQIDDLSVKVIANGCAINTPAFEQSITDTSARVNGEKVSLAVAIAKAADLLRASNQPIMGGCATDVNGMRGVMAVADKAGAIVDNMNFMGARRNFLAMQDTGWMNTTLAEIKNRCDYLLVVGVDLEDFSPRFFEQYVWNKESMFLDDTSNREIVYLGKAPSSNASTSPAGIKAKVLACADADLPEVMQVLRALVKNKKIVAESVGGIKTSELQIIAEQLKFAKYSVVTWFAGALNFDQAELTVQMLSEMVKDLNTMGTRSSGFPLGGKEGDQTANQVCGWISAYPARTKFSAGYPEYDPFLFDSYAMLANGEADVLCWIQSFNSTAVPAKTDLPTIVIARSGMIFDKEPDVFIPVGTPGIDHAGHAYRLDNVVAIRLKKLRDSGLPSTADVLNAIEQAL
jgi:formylmethanofuran dehydrogenase subunit B